MVNIITATTNNNDCHGYDGDCDNNDKYIDLARAKSEAPINKFIM